MEKAHQARNRLDRHRGTKNVDVVMEPKELNNDGILKKQRAAFARMDKPKQKQTTGIGGDMPESLTTNAVAPNHSKFSVFVDGKVAESFSSRRFDDAVINCIDFIEDATDYEFWLEKKFGIDKGFLSNSEISPRMRSILIDWIIQVQNRFRLLIETFFLTVNILDRYLASADVDKSILQLVGCTAIFIASKYEEIYPVDLSDITYLCDHAFPKRDILQMEIKILSKVGIDFGRPPVIHFIRFLTKPYNISVHTLAKYIGETAVCNYETCHLLPSTIAAVSVWIATILFDEKWSTDMYVLSRKSSDEIQKWTPVFAKYLLKKNADDRLDALRKKFSTPQNLRVAVFSVEQLEILRHLSST